MNDSKTLERHPLTIEMSFLRRTAESEHFYKDRVLGAMYQEFREVWKKLSDDPKWELHPDAPKERLSQVPTGRYFIYCDVVPGESDEDPETKAQTDAMFFIIDPHDWTYHRMRQYEKA